MTSRLRRWSDDSGRAVPRKSSVSSQAAEMAVKGFHANASEMGSAGSREPSCSGSAACVVRNVFAAAELPKTARKP
eukprot:CAMPEP_0115832424 /NCGR_PEP_ID=MMETSP0287-20121206/2650_1 /TAXON_ID=412157 /ORGANISM="Chrysochromulina rotalis, Strain UIO044" /LENGTH=75 /DNA_ID=CAMNT_0003285807 /DNA_START=181 /DNA_END=405 /DNA_ORIENTATION=+